MVSRSRRRDPVTAGRSFALRVRTSMITDIEEFFLDGCGRCERFATTDCSTRQWGSGLAKLRQICLGIDLLETVKWGHPCYMHANRNIAIMGALRNDFRLSFFNAALMKDPNRVLEKQGPNTQYPDMIRFVANDQVAKMKLVIESYLVEAMAYAEAGLKPPKQKGEVQLPDELLEALESDLELADAFYGLTPGRKRAMRSTSIRQRKPKRGFHASTNSETRFSRERGRWNGDLALVLSLGLIT